MKFTYLIVALLLMTMCLPVGALKLTFNQPSDMNDISLVTGSNGGIYFPISQVISYTTTKGYIFLGTTTNGGTSYFYNSVPVASTYSACSLLSWSGGSLGAHPTVILFSSSGAVLYQYNDVSNTVGRWEVKVSGGVAKIYIDGVNVATSGSLATNPYGVAYGAYTASNGAISLIWDDYIIGETSSIQDVIGIPTNQQFIILKDLVTPAASGIAFGNNGTVVQATNFPITFGRGDIAIPPDVPYPNKSINLVHYATGTVYSTQYTSTDMQGSRNILMAPLFASTTAPSGLYAVTIEGSGQYSDLIFYGSNGASVAFDKDSYSTGDTATVTYAITDGYWDTTTYAYTIVTQDIYGTIIDTQTVTTQTGTKSVEFSDTDVLGVYYTVLKATPSGADAIWMNYDVADLNAYITYSGYVMNAETGAVISGAHLNVSQGSSYLPTTSAADGNWSSSNNWLSNSAMRINTTATGYTQDIRTFTALSAKSIAINISLMPDPPTAVGVTIGGIVRDDQFGNPITGATYHVGSNTATTNIAGFARIGSLVHGTVYDVYSTKTGYSDSTHHSVTAVGI